MREALREAEAAAAAGEIPIGAIIERDGRVIGRGRNRTEREKDPTAHAEIEAIRQAAKALGSWRLTGCRMYVTTEPCAMCAGALVLARMDKVYIGTPNAKGGACVSLYSLLGDDRLNHRVEMEIGVLREDCAYIMKEFFARLRSKKRAYSEDDDQ
ncbi:MAG: nucleoside deaminase [Clostridiales Family XIII bacterium]|jgi:tRNA(adenine34) deaminase|nr:nucleoside deaminase [Clostridiales Family XIII bacterium]